MSMSNKIEAQLTELMRGLAETKEVKRKEAERKEAEATTAHTCEEEACWRVKERWEEEERVA